MPVNRLTRIEIERTKDFIRNNPTDAANLFPEIANSGGNNGESNQNQQAENFVLIGVFQ